MIAGRAFRALLYMSILPAAAPFAQPEPHAGVPVGSVCVALDRTSRGQTSVAAEEVAAALSAYLASIANRSEDECAAIVFSARAAHLAVTLRIAESERDAERSLDILDRIYPHDDPVILRPLATLALMQLELGKTGQLRRTVRRMQLIRTERPMDRALVHTVAARLLHTDGRLKEAEAEYEAALRAMADAGLGNSADPGSNLLGLAFLHIQERQFHQARRVLDRAEAIFNEAGDAVEADRIGLLYAQGILYARQRQWLDAERKIREALSIVDREKVLSPFVGLRMLPDYAAVLRKLHRVADARSIETRAAALGGHSPAAAVVDVTELSADRKLRKR